MIIASLRTELLWLACLGALAGSGGCTPSSVATLEIHGTTMGTQYSVQIPGFPRQLDVDNLKTQIEQRLLTVEKIASTYRDDSQLSHFNRSRDTAWFPVSTELAELVEMAKMLNRQSNGAFDASVGPLVNLWGFGPDDTVDVPNSAQLKRARERLGMHSLQVRRSPKPALRKSIADLYLDLSAIAKGYAIDRIALLLNGANISAYLVEIGGDIRVRGGNAKGQAWRIAIESPHATERSVAAIFSLREGAVATSGSYRNVRQHGDQSFSHIIDPVTGRPIDHQLLSVTVLSDSAMRADGLATTLLVMGPERGLQWASEHHLDAAFIIRDGERTTLLSSGNLADRLIKQ